MGGLLIRRLLLAGLVLLVLLFAPGRAGSLLARAITVRYSPTPWPTPQATPAPLATPVPDLPLEEGWTEYCEPDEGFAVALPEGWHRVDLESPLLAGRGAGDLPNIAPVSWPGSDRRLPAGPDIPFSAYDLGADSVAGGFMANINVLHRPLDRQLSAAEFGLDNLNELEKAARLVGPVAQEMVTLPAGEAMRFSYQIGLGAQDSELILAMTQLLLVRDQAGYVLTFATMPAQEERYAPVFDKIASSFRWLPG